MTPKAISRPRLSSGTAMMPSLPMPSTTALPAAVDLIRFEKNLLQIGFFGAHDTRHNNHSTRRIEQWVNRNGQKIKVAAEFRGSSTMGLPSTSDRDKYIAFMKIAMDQRAKQGRLENPVRFTGYQMLKELGLTYSGENYEDINRWGQRMADTTITSEQVIYLAARMKYANKTVHVFRSFTRAGETNSEDTGRAECYEVMLEDWLLENLNQSYVIPEDFNAYRKLKRPTGKGIFGYLHLWFHASQGRTVEKDYTELCTLLNIPVYRHVSKIKETMGRSLDELSQVGYLSSWDIRPMVSKEGFKLVLQPGAELLHVLAISQRKTLPETETKAVELDEKQQAAAQALQSRGVAAQRAANLAKEHAPEYILDAIGYAQHLLVRDRRGKIENPAGFLVYLIENRVGVPAEFSGIRHQSASAAALTGATVEDPRIRLEKEYAEFIDQEIETELNKRFPGSGLADHLKRVIVERKRHDEQFARMTANHQRDLASHFLRQEVKDALPIPTFEEWVSAQGQMHLDFSRA
jgi:hypothetical protein